MAGFFTSIAIFFIESFFTGHYDIYDMVIIGLVVELGVIMYGIRTELQSQN
jgi:hypothetical protein